LAFRRLTCFLRDDFPGDGSGGYPVEFYQVFDVLYYFLGVERLTAKDIDAYGVVFRECVDGYVALIDYFYSSVARVLGYALDDVRPF